MKTLISDSFPLEKLECQFYDICLFYNPRKCGYGEPCYIGDNRKLLRLLLEDYVSEDCLKNQIEEIEKEK